MMITTLAVLIGAILGFALTYVFNILPEAWLQDYDYDPKAPDYRPSKRMRPLREGIISAIALAAFYGISAAVCFDDFSDKGHVIHIIVIMLAIPMIILIGMADRLNRIIPDQFSIYLLILGIVSACGDYIDGTYWFSDDAPAYFPFLNRLIAAAIGAGFLWLVEFMSETFLGKEGMGQGDMKLLGACGLLCGTYGLVILIYAAIIPALLVAIPLYIRKKVRIYREEKEIRASKDPVAKRREIRLRKAKLHFAEDPDYLAFGPFLAFGAGVFLALEPFWADKLMETLDILGVYF